jgi:hypothetical protein
MQREQTSIACAKLQQNIVRKQNNKTLTCTRACNEKQTKHSTVGCKTTSLSKGESVREVCAQRKPSTSTVDSEHLHAHAQTHKHDMHAHAHAHARTGSNFTHIHAHAYACARTIVLLISAHKHTRTHMHTLARANTSLQCLHAYARTHMCTCKRTHACTQLANNITSISQALALRAAAVAGPVSWG